VILLARITVIKFGRCILRTRVVARAHSFTGVASTRAGAAAAARRLAVESHTRTKKLTE